MSIVTVRCRTAYLQDYDANSDKFYRTYEIGPWAVFQWGRRGVVGQFKAEQFSGPRQASEAAQKKLNSKHAEGYRDLDEVSFDYDPTFISTDKASCVRLDDVRQAAAPSRVPVSTPSSTASPAPPPKDLYADFTERALQAITLAVTDPQMGAIEYALLNAQWPELEQVHAKAQSYLKTLDSLVLGASA